MIANHFIHMCNTAQRLKTFKQGRSIAKRIDPEHSRAWTDDMLFYYFTDGSSAGTSRFNRSTHAREWNCWVIQGAQA